MNNRVIHFEIQADNVDRAIKFYQRALGWKIEKYKFKEEKPMMEYWMVMTGKGPGIDGGMYMRPKERAEQFYTYDCTITVEDIDKAVAAVKEAGGTINREKSMLPEVGWFAGCRDTEGNRFALMQPVGWQPK